MQCNNDVIPAQEHICAEGSIVACRKEVQSK